MDAGLIGPTERRATVRSLDPQDHGIVRTRIRPGHEALLLDISAGGACIETAYRLLPGTFVELHLETDLERAYARGRVVRCTVSTVHASNILFRGAVSFAQAVTWWHRQRTDGPLRAAP